MLKWDRSPREWEYTLDILKLNDGRFELVYRKTSGLSHKSMTHSRQHGNTLADAAAAMYCFLAEQKLLPPADGQEA